MGGKEKANSAAEKARLARFCDTGDRKGDDPARWDATPLEVAKATCVVDTGGVCLVWRRVIYDVGQAGE